MNSSTGLLFGPLPPGAVHLCVDMQRLFSSAGPWPVPWIEKIMPAVVDIAKRFPERTIFTRFVPPQVPHVLPGMWQRYYRFWREVTLDRIDPRLLDLLPPLADMAPPAVILDRPFYSAFSTPRMLQCLSQRGANTIVITGGETDVCILSTVMSAVDYGYRVVLVVNALCSTSDENHDSLMTMFNNRFSKQVETVDSEMLLSAWAKH
jgi:nicotinamidase-related amidase